MSLEYIEKNYKTYIKIFSDGSKQDNGETGEAFVIPSEKVYKSFHIGKFYSIFTAEFVGIYQTLCYLEKRIYQPRKNANMC